MAPILRENALPRRKLLGIRPSEMDRHQTEPVPAKVAEDLRGNFSVRERVDMLGGLLRELALGLHGPVLPAAGAARWPAAVARARAVSQRSLAALPAQR